MPRYFFDLDYGATNYVDAIGTELADQKTVECDAVRFLASVFKDAAQENRDHGYLVRVRDETGRVIFTTTLALQSNWWDAEDRAGAAMVGQPVVLIVEHDFISRVRAAEMIGERGFEVVQAQDADQALAILETHPNVQVVFTDIRLPGSMDGLKFAKYVRSKWPPIKIIATSGHVVVRDEDLPDGAVFLPKPYTSDKVTNAIRECTGAS